MTHKPLSRRRVCAGRSGQRPRCPHVGTRRRPVRHPGRPSCFEPAGTSLENGSCAMTDMSSLPNDLSARKPDRRIMAIWLPRLAIDRWRRFESCRCGEGADAEPVALIAETAHGPRITAANDVGLAAGARPGLPLTDARTLCPSLKAVPNDPEGDWAFLQRLALWAQRWGPWSAPDAPDGLFVDVSAVAHLFGGEGDLLTDVERRLVDQGLASRTAIAPTAGAAWALAHYGSKREILAPT